MINSKILDHLKQQLEGELYTDSLHQALYAVDASVYRELPLAVALPKDTDDIKCLVRFAGEHGLALIPRAAGTSLAGQCVGNGIVVDISKYMNGILEINTQEKYVWVEPGVVRDELNHFLKDYKLHFGPNTSTSNRATIGGMMGNNSCGSTSIVYGSTRDHILAAEVVLADGSLTRIEPLNADAFHEKRKQNNLEGKIYEALYTLLNNEDFQKEIDQEFPKKTVSRRNTGYALDYLIHMQPFTSGGTPFNLNQLLSGSEGTLAFTTKIKLNLVDLPPAHDVLVAAHFNTIDESMLATVEVMKHSPTACELMDKTILDCTKGHLMYDAYRAFVSGDPEAILIIEFRENSLEIARKKASTLIEQLKANQLGYHYGLITGSETHKVWDLRKAGLGLLANIPGDPKAVACIEDTAVAVADLPAYIKAFSELMTAFNQKAVYYAHAGAGELHLRPVLNLKDPDDVKDFEAISKASAKLVKEYQGSLSGEHGDGRVRAPFIPLVFSDHIYEAFKHIKNTFDPHHIFNPGKIVNAKPITADLRYDASQMHQEIDTVFDFSDTGGILRTVEKCNGSGDCRKLSFAGGTMCPSYRATLDEQDTTRGRANVLRELLTQNTKTNPFDHPEIAEAMDLCISCKGCKSECPSNVDMATLKAEFLYQYRKSNASSLRAKLIAKNARLNAMASRFAGLVNAISATSIFKNAIGFSKERTLPQLRSVTLRKFLRKHHQPTSSKKVYVFIDEYTNYYDVEIGKKAVFLLNALGYEVLIKSHEESGRAYISKGFLDEAKAIATSNVTCFSGDVTETTPLIGIEPSALLSFRDEYPKLVDPSLRKQAEDLQQHVMLIDEFLAQELKKGAISKDQFSNKTQQILLHGHCHQKALSSTVFTKEILSIPENYSVVEIPSGCCGMAGSFGFEKEHYQLSMQIGEDVLFPKLRDADDHIVIAASGTSCRHQIKDGTNKKALHPIEILFDALNS